MIDDAIVQPEDIETPEAPEVEIEDDELEPEVPDVAPPNETAEQKDARIAKLEERNGKLWARLQRNKKKPAPVTPAPAKPAETPTGLTREEGILYSKGFEEDEVEYAQKVATLQGVKLTEAVKDPLFTTWKSNKDADQKKQAAQLGTSKGARTTIKKSFDTPGLSDEDHKALFKEAIG
jgi:hypothetical protein